MTMYRDSGGTWGTTDERGSSCRHLERGGLYTHEALAVADCVDMAWLLFAVDHN